MKRSLEVTLQALYDSEINVTITMLWDGGVDFAFISYMEFDSITPEIWHNVKSFSELADALHERALREYPNSDYAKQYGGGQLDERGTVVQFKKKGQSSKRDVFR
jgi:hypothetical protein